ncbi:MAG TPA: pyruvate dehydrogenase complex dihydrolipoamide acetyltransferase [Rubricoccaceae bacterium]|nr:pyruvate dehydrogenase complex dihydrolipoamide acetyltransferase [Rubricoccaceae bacterium]
MAIAVEMPKMSDTMEEGVLVAWLANEGDEVSAGDVIAQVETDKATMDLEVYDDGVLLKRVVPEGASVPIGGLIAVLGKAGESPDDVLAKYGGGDGAAEEQAAPPAEPSREEDGAPGEVADTPAEADRNEGATVPTAGPAAPSGGDGAAAPATEAAPVAEPAAQDGGADEGRIKASPLARRMAQERGLDLRTLAGTGPEGRIVKRDVEAALEGKAPAARPAAPAEAPRSAEVPARPTAPARPAAPALEEGAYEAVPISQMRKTIARRLAQSKFTAPHFYLTVDVDMARAVDFRRQLNEVAEAQGRTRISFNDLITKACAVALRLHPAVNSSWVEEQNEMRRHHEVHVAVAVAIEDGLVTPVVRNPDRKGLAEIAEETQALAERARNRQLQPPDWEGSTFTTSNLGMFGIEEFTAIINPPNACILAIGAIRDVPVVHDGELVAGKRMKVTLSCDHRVVDGATGAAFLADVKRFLEEPMLMLL